MADKNKKVVVKAKRKSVAFDWTTDSIEKASLLPPVAPIKLANTDLESIIARVTERKKEQALRESKRCVKHIKSIYQR